MLILLFFGIILFEIYFIFRNIALKEYYINLLEETYKELRLHFVGFREESLPFEKIPSYDYFLFRFWIPISKLPTYSQLKKSRGVIKDIKAYDDYIKIKYFLGEKNE